MTLDKKKLLVKAKRILENNWRETYTVPSPRLYPHQWSWDSAFISIGNSHFNQDSAQKELSSMFEGQWKNGMVPHIIFRSNESYFPGPDYWNIELSDQSPNIKTSGITHPSVHAIAALKIYENAVNKEKAERFLENLYPKLLEFHRYLLTVRDPENTGLVTIIHPWESGIDNSIRWDEAMNRIKVHNIPKYERVDNKKISDEQRPSDKEYDRFVYLIEILKKNNYNISKYYDKYPFRIKDIVFSSILYAANKSLKKIANILGEKTNEIDKWLNLTQNNYFKYFCSGYGENKLVYDYDLIIKKRIEKRAAASFISLFTGLISNEQAKKMVDWMNHSHVCTNKCQHKHPAITTTAVNDEQFSPINYWRGPIWINVNWMIYNGLKSYGFKEESNNLYRSIINLVDEHGFYEYYNPLTGVGLGSDNFSWTAALILDLIFDNY